MAVDMLNPAVDLPKSTAVRESQTALMWRRFRRHRLALISMWIVLAFYLVAIFAEFLAPTDPSAYNPRFTYAPPQGLHFIGHDADGGLLLGPYVYGYKTEIDPVALRRT